MKYLAIGFWISDTGEDFTLSRETNIDDDPIEVAKMLCKEADFPKDRLSVVLLIRAGQAKKGKRRLAPEVHKFWRATDGDFDDFV